MMQRYLSEVATLAGVDIRTHGTIALQFGAATALLVGEAVTLIGFVVTLAWGTETRGRSLGETSASQALTGLEQAAATAHGTP